MHAIESPARPQSRLRRWKGLGILSVVTLLLHAAAFSGLGWAWPVKPSAPMPAAAMQVRVVEPEPLGAPAAAMPVAPFIQARRAAVSVAAKTAGETKSAPAAAAAPVATPTAAARMPVPEEAVPIQIALDTIPTRQAAVASATIDDEPIPHYRTRLPPAITLRYEMQHGFLRGIGELSWRPQGDHYELKLDARVGGLPVLTQVSAGGFDAAGVAPVRFTDQRLRRGITAANFQRAAGKITFSGPSTEFGLAEGAQDRLSWMVQLAAIVAAEPQLRIAGAKVAMVVVGSQGAAGVWVFRCIGAEAVTIGAGTIEAIKFMREPRDAYDTTVQVWLDPRQYDLPVRATQKSGPNDQGFELRLQEVISTR